MTQRTFEDLAADFEFLDDWEDRYRYVMELGRELEPFPEEARTEANKVNGCVSQVWLLPRVEKAGTEDAVIHFQGDSDAMIVRGLVAILLTMISGKKARDLLDMDIKGNLARLGLEEHLTQQRANGLTAMVERVRAEARKALGEE